MTNIKNKNIQILIVFILLFILIPQITFAQRYKQEFNNGTAGNNNSTGGGNNNKNNKDNNNKNSGGNNNNYTPPKKDYSYRQIPQSVIRVKNVLLTETATRIGFWKKDNQVPMNSIVNGSYTLRIPIERDGNIQYVKKKGNHKVIITKIKNSLTKITKNLRSKHHDWTVTGGSATYAKRTTGSTNTVIFNETGTFFIRAKETMEYDIYEYERATAKVQALHNGEVVSTTYHNGEHQFVESKTKPGNSNSWNAIFIGPDDVGKPIQIGPGYIGKHKNGGGNNGGGGGNNGGGNNNGNKSGNGTTVETNKKDDIKIDYELVE